MQWISDYDDPEADFSLIRGMAASAKRPMSVVVTQRHEAPEKYKLLLRLLRDANEQSLEIKGQVACRSAGIVMGLRTTLHPFMMNPEWKRLSSLPVEENRPAA